MAKKYEDSNKFISKKSLDDLKQDVESYKYIRSYVEERDRFIPHVDFSSASNFAKYGLAEQYYEDSIKRIYNGGYSGFQIGNGGAPLPISDYSAVKVSIYGEQNVGNLRFSINALNEQELGVILQVEEGQWNDFEISLDDPALIGENELEVFSQIVIQELSGNSNVIIYIDDLGLI